MRLCVLSSSYAATDSPFSGLDPDPDPSLWAKDYDWETHRLEKASAVEAVGELTRRGFDAFVNLCDGCADEPLAGIEVAVALERAGVAYTGTNPRFYEPTRRAMKRQCQRLGIDTPRYRFVQGRGATAAGDLRFPVLVKHPNSYGSIGLTPANRVARPEALPAVVDRMVAEYGGALLEEFIEGREFSVLVTEPGEDALGPRTYAPLEVVFPPGESFKHFDLKWVAYEGMSSRPVADARLSARLQRLAARIFEGFRGVGYARCDVRMDRAGRLYLIDLNPNPGVFYAPEAFGTADRIISLDPGGHRAFLDHIVAAALRRRDRRARRSRRVAAAAPAAELGQGAF